MTPTTGGWLARGYGDRQISRRLLRRRRPGSVLTPLSEDGGPDLRPVHSAARAVREHITPGALVILESTTYIPGRPSRSSRPGDSRRPDGGRQRPHRLSPERIDPSEARFAAKNTLKVVVL